MEESSRDNSSPAEITVKAVVLSVILSVILASANAYLGLFAALTVSASIPAAVVSMGILRLFRKSNMLENNIVQTAASAGEALAAGVIYTLPALIILDYWTDFNYIAVTVIACFGGVLGVFFTIPLRRALIIEQKIKFPEGIATAQILKTGESSRRDIKYILEAAVAAGLFKFGQAGLGLWTDAIEAARSIGGTVAYFGCNLSPALISVGYIVGLNIAMLIFLGGLCNWLIAIPLCAANTAWPEHAGQAMPAIDFARMVWSSQTRYVGVGAMLTGGLWTIVKLRRAVISGVLSGLAAYRGVKEQGDVLDRTVKDIPMKWILICTAVSVLPLFILYQVFVGRLSVSIPMAVIMLITGFLFSAVAAYMAGLVGSSNNPISGVTIATVLVSSLLLVVLMPGAAAGAAAAIIIGSVICCAAAISGDNIQDLKTGHIVGATPWKQQVMQIVGTLTAGLVIAPVLNLLLKAYGFAGHTSAKSAPLVAAQANLMASVAKGVFEGRLPWTFIIIGAVVGCLIIIIDNYLERKGSGIRTPVLAVAIGFYLPFELSVPIFIGGLINYIVKTGRAETAAAAEHANQKGLLFASGLITGEAITGVLIAIPIVLTGRADVLTISAISPQGWPGLILMVAIALWLYLTARRSKGPA